MIAEFFILLMFYGTPSTLQEFTVRESLVECLSTKRKIERTMGITEREKYNGSVRWACKKMKVEVDDQMNIINFVEE